MSPSSSYPKIIQNKRLYPLVTYKSSKHVSPPPSSVTSRHATSHTAFDLGQSKWNHTNNRADKRINQFVWCRSRKQLSIAEHPSILPSFHFVTLFVQFTSRDAKTRRRRDEGVGGWSKDTVCDCYLWLSQQIWSSELTASQYSSAQSTEIESTVASRLEFGSQWVHEYIIYI